MKGKTAGSDNLSHFEKKDLSLSVNPEISSAVDPFAEWEPGKIVLDEYVVKRKLGRGGMGVVYLVEKNITDGVIQFAVKTLHPILFAKPGANQPLLRELRTWTSLPPHPHIVSCRFFRTIDNKMAIFSEYVDGGSLSEWIAGDRIRSIEQILDIAIQTAWALQAVHDRNVIHQDVKPSNILMTQDGIAKLTDFGISNARRNEAVTSDAILPNQHSILVSTRGCTPAYCSPEQAARHKVTRHTDMWSWAVTVLQMFTGKVRWALGAMVPDYLETLAHEQTPSTRFPIPEILHQLLNQCLQDNPKNRWRTMADIAEKLVWMYREIYGHPFERKPPEGTIENGRTPLPFVRVTATGWEWSDPEQWLRKAYEAHEIPYRPPGNRTIGTRRELMLNDLEILEDALILFRRLSGKASENYLDDVIAAVADKSVLLTELNDLSGAIYHYEQAIEWITHHPGLPEQRKTILLLELYKGKADTLVVARSLHDAVETYQLIRSIFRERLDIPDTLRMLSLRIRSGVNLAYALYFLGRSNEALDLYAEFLNEMTTPVYRERVNVADVELGTLHLNRGLAFWQLNRLTEALQEYDSAIALHRTPEYQAKAPDPVSDLAKALSNKALILQNLCRFEESECHFLEAILLIEKQLLAGTRSGLSGVLGVLYTNIAGMYASRNDLRIGLKYVSKARNILNQNVNLEGVREFENQISRMLMHEATCLVGLGQREQAFRQIWQAVSLLERLVYEFNRDDLRQELAWCYETQAGIMEAAGLPGNASNSAKKAIHLCHILIENSRTGETLNTLLISRCIEARAKLRQGLAGAVTEIKSLVLLLEQELEKTQYNDLKRQLDLMQQVLEESGEGLSS